MNVQLINAQTDSHLWGDTYERKLTDILDVESEIAKGIAESLQAKLTGREERALAVKPTDNPEAYDAYLRGLAFEARSSYSIDLVGKAIDSYERAVQIDPNFALAWARLSRVHALVYSVTADTTATRRDASKNALQNAQKLQPNSPETLLALGYYQYLVLRDYGLAKTTFRFVSKMLPGSSEVPSALAAVTRREGIWDESIAYVEQGLILDPRNAELLNGAAWIHVILRQFPAALRFLDRALDVLPDDPNLLAMKARVYLADGKPQEAANLLSTVNVQTPSEISFLTKITQLRLQRNYAEAIRLLQTRQAQFQFSSDIDKGINELWLALAQRVAGDTAGAKVAAERAHNTLEPFSKIHPDNFIFAGALCLTNATVGDKNSALREYDRATVLLANAKDRVHEPTPREVLALIEMIFGENSRAISTLTQLLETPYSGWFYYATPVTPALLRLDPIWDPLRGDPDFQKLCEEKQP